MSRPTLLSTHVLFDAPRERLAEHFDVEYWTEPERPPRAEVLRRIAGKDALISLLTESIDDELLDAAPALRIVANVAVGYDNIDLAACTRRKIAVTNTPGVLDETTADLAWTLILAVARRLIEGDTLARSGQWRGWNLDQLCGSDIWGKTLGILGFGRIGRAVARRARGFNMRVIYHSRHRAPADVEMELKAEHLPLDQLLAQADFLSLHVPLTPETRGLIGARAAGQDEAIGLPDQHDARPRGAGSGPSRGSGSRHDRRRRPGRLRARAAHSRRPAPPQRSPRAAPRFRHRSKRARKWP